MPTFRNSRAAALPAKLSRSWLLVNAARPEDFAPALASEATLQPIRRYGMDGAILFADIMTPLDGAGVAPTASSASSCTPHGSPSTIRSPANGWSTKANIPRISPMHLMHWPNTGSDLYDGGTAA